MAEEPKTEKPKTEYETQVMAVNNGQKLNIPISNVDIDMFKIKMPDAYGVLENIALRRIIAASQLTEKE